MYIYVYSTQTVYSVLQHCTAVTAAAAAHIAHRQPPIRKYNGRRRVLERVKIAYYYNVIIVIVIIVVHNTTRVCAFSMILGVPLRWTCGPARGKRV